MINKEQQMSTENRVPQYCGLPEQRPRVLPQDLSSVRLSAIRVAEAKWVNGTVLHYHFLDGPEEQRDVVRKCFQAWKDIPIGLSFTEVDDVSEAEIRIAFDASDGSWSYVGRAILDQPATQPTMNFGWDLTTEHGRSTALHEIGHTLGEPHEHQNPFAGIVWDEEAVYLALGGPPNNWPREQTQWNVLRKLNPSEVEGSSWDPDSIMHYEFEAGMIREPAKYRNGITPPGTLSELDKQWIMKWYPGQGSTQRELKPFTSELLDLDAGEQADFTIQPPATRTYQLATFGDSDTVIVLFEEIDGQPRYVKSDDDSGAERNAQISAQLISGRRYVLKVRLYWPGVTGQTAVMCW
jgi:hypothetical protein